MPVNHSDILKETNKELIIIDKNNVNERIKWHVIAHGKIVQVDQVIHIDFSAFNFLLLSPLLAKHSNFENTIVIISDRVQATICVLIYVLAIYKVRF